MQENIHTILIVDDDESNIFLLQENLYESYRVLTANNAIDALSILDTESPSVIVSDYRMPLMNGVDFLTQAVVLSPDCVPIIMTAYGDQSLAFHTINDLSFFHFLQKPVDVDYFLLTIKNAVDIYDLRVKNNELSKKTELQTDYIDQENERRLKILIDKNNTYNDSLLYAQGIQQALFPFPSFFEKHFADHFILYKPKDIVSGDFYWAYETADSNQVIVVLGDCTGHGVPGALLSMLGMKAIDSIVHHEKVLQPAQILTELHNSIRNILKQNQTGNVDGMDAAVIAWNKTNNKVKYAGAKMPIVLFKSTEMIRIIGNNREIGGVSLSVPRIFAEQEFDIRPGESIYLFSDGFVDQFGGVERRKLMSKRFFGWLNEISAHQMSDQRDILWENMQNWMETGNERQLDDMLMLALKF